MAIRPDGLDYGRSDIELAARNAGPMTAQDWHDVADLCEQGKIMAGESTATHTRKACERAAKWMDALVLRATKNGMKKESP